MKLPEFKYRYGVSSLGRIDSSLPTQQAYYVNIQNQAATRQTNEALGHAINSIESAYKTHLDVTLQSMDIDTQNQISTWEVDHDKTEFDANEVPEDLSVRKTETVIDAQGNSTEVIREKIPAYEVYPDWYRKYAQAVIDSQADRISNPKFRDQWHKEKTAILNKNYAAAMVASAEKVKKYQDDKSVINIDQSITAGNYNMALQVAQAINDPLLKETQTKMIKEKAETSDYDKAVIAEDLDLLKGAVSFLELEDYHKYGSLEEGPRRIWTEYLRGQIREIENRSIQKDRAGLELLKDEARTTVSEAESGMDFQPQYYTNLLDRLSKNVSEPGIPTLIRDVEVARILRTAAPEITEVPHYLRYAAMQDAMHIKYGNSYEAKVMRKLNEISEKANEVLRRSPMDYMFRYGKIKSEEYVQIDFGTLEGIEKGISGRLPLMERTVKATGYTKGGLLPDEVTTLVGMFQSGNKDDQIALAKSIVKGAKDRYAPFFEQLADGGLEGSYVAMGVAAAEGDMSAARMLQEGQRRLSDKNEKWLDKDVSLDLAEYVQDRFMNSYPMSEEFRSTMVQAFNAAYVSQLAFNERLDTSYDETKADKAFAIATGGLVEWGGAVVLPPRRNFGQDKWEKYFKGDTSFHPTELNMMNDGDSPIKYSVEEIAKGLKNEDRFTLLDTGLFSSNSYYIIDSYDGKPIQSSSGQAFLFKYRDDYLSMGEAKEEYAAERMAERRQLVRSQKEIYEDTSLVLKAIKQLRNVTQSKAPPPVISKEGAPKPTGRFKNE